MMKEDVKWEKEDLSVPKKEIINVVEPTEKNIVRKVRVCKSGKNQLIRIPVEITDELNIETGDYFVFDVHIPLDESKKGKTVLKFTIEKGEE